MQYQLISEEPTPGTDSMSTRTVPIVLNRHKLTFLIFPHI